MSTLDHRFLNYNRRSPIQARAYLCLAYAVFSCIAYAEVWLPVGRLQFMTYPSMKLDIVLRKFLATSAALALPPAVTSTPLEYCLRCVD